MTPAPVCPLRGGAAFPPYERCLDLEYFISASYSYHRCSSCGFVFMHPLPTREELPSLYPSDYRNYEAPSNPLSAYLVDRFHSHHVAVSRRLLPAGGSFLEIGSAGGDVLARLRDRGFEKVQGIEISPDGVAVSRAKGLEVFCGTLEEFATDDRFDLILMSHVIEHVLDPVGTVEKIFSLLKPRGVLYVETPNVRSLDARLWGSYWGLIHYPRHLCLFDRVSLRRLLAGAGFEVEKMSWEINSCG